MNYAIDRAHFKRRIYIATYIEEKVIHLKFMQDVFFLIARGAFYKSKTFEEDAKKRRKEKMKKRQTYIVYFVHTKLFSLYKSAKKTKIKE